jgi:hypothetical protein
MSHRIVTAIAFTGILILPALADSPKVPTGKAINEAYRAQFAQCDAHDTFAGVQFPIRRANGSIVWYGCHADPSRFARFEAVAASAAAPHAVIIQSKLGWDEDGSTKACGPNPGPTDQCTTSLMLKPTASAPCPPRGGAGKYCFPLNADTIPYIVIPAAAPRGIDSGAFRRFSGVKVGDYGVVVANGKVVPVIVGDIGPAYKIGEGSTALLKALSNDDKPHTFGSGVDFILFPGTLDPVDDLSSDGLADMVQKKGSELYGKLVSP